MKTSTVRSLVLFLALLAGCSLSAYDPTLGFGAHASGRRRDDGGSSIPDAGGEDGGAADAGTEASPGQLGDPCRASSDCDPAWPYCADLFAGETTGTCSRSCARDADCGGGGCIDGVCLRLCEPDCQNGFVCDSIHANSYDGQCANGTCEVCLPNCRRTSGLCGTGCTCDGPSGTCDCGGSSGGGADGGTGGGGSGTGGYCAACSADADCVPGGYCLEETNGSFCGTPCQTDADCAPEAVCDALQDQSGNPAGKSNCVPLLQLCGG